VTNWVMPQKKPPTWYQRIQKIITEIIPADPKLIQTKKFFAKTPLKLVLSSQLVGGSHKVSKADCFKGWPLKDCI
jgi:hypothetical protein